MLDQPPHATDGYEASHEIQELHQRCGVYTRTELVAHVLDSVGWVASEDLFNKRLLEPSAGDGQFLVAAVERLIASCKANEKQPSVDLLAGVITAFELHPLEGERARANMRDALSKAGLDATLSARLADGWLQVGDFLLSDLPSGYFSHVVGNPPYVRWSSIPDGLRRSYELALPRRMTRGDLFLPFLDRGIQLLATGGRLGFVCSDRWKFMAFAEDFRRDVLPTIDVERDEKVDTGSAYLRQVDAYASAVVFRKRASPLAPPSVAASDGRYLADAGYIVRVGPALGNTQAFVLTPESAGSVEPELLAPWVDGTEVGDGELAWSGRKVLCLYGADGQLRDIEQFPQALAHMSTYRGALEQRAISKAGAPWYRPIDRVQADMWKRPKLLVPELAKVPRVALDESGAVPSHGVYAIFAQNDDLTRLYERLLHGGLAKVIGELAPRVKGGYVRCYKRFLDKIDLDRLLH